MEEFIEDLGESSPCRVHQKLDDFRRVLADVIHAAPGGKTERMCRDLMASGRNVAVLDRDANRSLLDAGATPVATLDALVHMTRSNIWPT